MRLRRHIFNIEHGTARSTLRCSLDALVAPAEEGPRLMSELQNASLSPLRPVERKNQRSKSYVLLTR